MFSLRKLTGWVLLVAGVLLFLQSVQLFFGVQSFFGLGLFFGKGGAMLESFVPAVICLGVGWWLARG
jgi:hypothetical protein